MKIEWTAKATGDLVRLHDFLSAIAPEAAARVVQSLTRAPVRLVEFPRIGEKLEAYDPREVRRIIVGDYEVRYEVRDGSIVVLRLWHHREDRAVDGG